ncbi:hypothetical protein D3C80_1925790 [compost metagenome]
MRRQGGTHGVPVPAPCTQHAVPGKAHLLRLDLRDMAGEVGDVPPHHRQPPDAPIHSDIDGLAGQFDVQQKQVGRSAVEDPGDASL